MDHAEAEPLVRLYADAELDPGLAGRFEAHLAECAICAARLGALQADHAILARALARTPAPSELRAKILNDIRGPARWKNNRRIAAPPWMQYAATIVATAFLAGAATLALTGRAGREPVADVVFNDHARALATHQMVAFASSDRHAVKPWFEGKVSYAPRIVDMSGKGFSLVGGRVDYIEGQPVAVIAYRRGPRLISLFLRPARRDDRPAHVVTRRGDFNIAWWSNGTFECWAVSDASARDLLQLRKSYLNDRGGSQA